ncbi:FHA domain-containing protein (plasmid) [Rhizobium sullae]|uniref:FHA domain-containing protein n=1 Tax=Rhizobium sullae TaxID=50338 RepID=A0ABY5XR49_RHISU|nr:FHA domain-containing protein [Rhizobium sullae]UWU17084.1 FHA domain-containing protein [Rhizobium sullae]
MASNLVLRNAAADLTLDVLNGVHSGVSLPLENGSYLIGSAPDCDLMLSDRDVSAHHMRLQFAGSEVMIEATGADVMVQDTSVPVGHGLHVKTPVTISLGSARLRLCRPAQAAPGRKADKSKRTTWMIGGAAAFSLLTIAAVQAGIANVGDRLPMASFDEKTVAAGTASASMPSADEVSSALAANLAAAGLSDLQVKADGTRFAVSGALDEEARKSWSDIQTWFDRSYGTNYVLTSMVGEAAAKTSPKFNLQAVWFGETPYAIGADGTHLYKGAALEDGWYIKDIRDGSLKVGRQGEEFILRF